MMGMLLIFLFLCLEVYSNWQQCWPLPLSLPSTQSSWRWCTFRRMNASLRWPSQSLGAPFPIITLAPPPPPPPPPPLTLLFPCTFSAAGAPPPPPPPSPLHALHVPHLLQPASPDPQPHILQRSTTQIHEITTFKYSFYFNTSSLRIFWHYCCLSPGCLFNLF